MKDEKSILTLQSIKYALSTFKDIFSNRILGICSLIILIFIAFKFDAGLAYDFYMFLGSFIVLTIVKYKELRKEEDIKTFIDDIDDINNQINFDLPNCNINKSKGRYYILPENFTDPNGNLIKEIAIKHSKTYFKFNVSVFDKDQEFIFSKDISLEEFSVFNEENLRNLFEER